MSAVRFGRIPKREKQRMLLEMQNAMNNLMSNNSQLHSMLQGNQSPPLSLEALPNDASPSPSSASSTCSNPSSPQCPQDSESVVSMDTNSSSASSCGSDSGEDEAVVTVTRQHRDAYTYDQHRSPRQDQGSPLPVTREMGCDSRMEEQQESWNHWNDCVVSGGYQHSHYGNSQHVTNGAYREERRVYQQPQLQQLNGTPSGETSEDSHGLQQNQHKMNAQAFTSGYNGPAHGEDHRAHLVSVHH